MALLAAGPRRGAVPARELSHGGHGGSGAAPPNPPPHTPQPEPRFSESASVRVGGPTSGYRRGRWAWRVAVVGGLGGGAAPPPRPPGPDSWAGAGPGGAGGGGGATPKLGSYLGSYA